MTIDRCVCFNVTFAEILERCKQEALDPSLGVEKIADKVDCCKKCQFCRPYLAAALRTGKTVFDPKEK